MAGRYPNFDYKKLDKIIHNRLRLAVLSSLYRSDEVDFVSLRNAVSATDGNLSVQLMNLEDAGYIVTNRNVHKNRLQTNVALTNEGRYALKRYKELMANWLQGL